MQEILEEMGWQFKKIICGLCLAAADKVMTFEYEVFLSFADKDREIVE